MRLIINRHWIGQWEQGRSRVPLTVLRFEYKFEDGEHSKSLSIDSSYQTVFLISLYWLSTKSSVTLPNPPESSILVCALCCTVESSHYRSYWLWLVCYVATQSRIVHTSLCFVLCHQHFTLSFKLVVTWVLRFETVLNCQYWSEFCVAPSTFLTIVPIGCGLNLTLLNSPKSSILVWALCCTVTASHYRSYWLLLTFHTAKQSWVVHTGLSFVLYRHCFTLSFTLVVAWISHC